MADREIVTSDNSFLSIVIALILIALVGFGIWAFASGKFGNPTQTKKIDVSVDMPKMPAVDVNPAN